MAPKASFGLIFSLLLTAGSARVVSSSPAVPVAAAVALAPVPASAPVPAALAVSSPVAAVTMPLASAFDINANVIAGGGGASTGGTFSLEGTIGQAVAGGALTGATFSVSSGFWHAVESTPTSTKKVRGQITSQ